MDKEKLMLSYLAGALDGDGSFSILKKSSGVGVTRKSIRHRPCLQLYGLSEMLTHLLKEYLGGSVGVRKGVMKKSGKISNPQFYWSLIGAEASILALKKICEYLVIKKERAKFLLDFLINHEFSPIGNRKELSPEILIQRENAYIKMREFNDEQLISEDSLSKRSCIISDDPMVWSYLAGLMDTDGSFSVSRQKPSGKCINFRYNSIIQLNQSNVKSINFIKENFSKGKCFIAKNAGSKLGAVYRFYISGIEKCSLFLEKIIPYLRVKKENAKILLKFCEGYSLTKRCEDGIPFDQLDFREQCYQELIYLNKYGIFKPSLIDLDGQKLAYKAEDDSHRERLSERDAISVCDSLDTSIAY